MAFVTVKNDVTETSYPAIVVSEDDATGTANLFVFEPNQPHFETVYAKEHAFVDEDGKYPFSYYELEATSEPTSSSSIYG